MNTLTEAVTFRPPLSSGGTGMLLRDCLLLERVTKALPRCLGLSLSTCMHTDANRRTSSVSDRKQQAGNKNYRSIDLIKKFTKQTNRMCSFVALLL